MIKNIRLENIGPFRDAGNGVGFGKLSLVYGDNGRGKTHFAEALHSAGTGNTNIINSRRGLDATEPPRINLIPDEGSKGVTFRDGKWDGVIKSLAVFNDSFVDRNVYSGLEVTIEHRKSLHNFILGETGVELARREEDLVKRREGHTSKLQEKAKAIPSSFLGELSVDAFCDLVELPDVDAQIQNVERSLRAARKSDAVKSTPPFAALELPSFDTGEITQLLNKDLPGLTRDAESRVHEQIKNSGHVGEEWIADGVGRLSGSNGTCPFCGQDVSSLPLIPDYQAYFSAAYSGLKKSVADTLEDLERDLTNAPTDFERKVRVATERRQFWSEFCDIPEIDIDTEAVVRDWRVAGSHLLALLRDKSASPLERVSIGEDTLLAIRNYDDHRLRVNSLSGKLTALHGNIELLKRQAEDADITALGQELSLLNAKKARYSPEMALPCDEYLKQRSAKERTDKELDSVKKELAQHREEVFPALEGKVNDYLDKFGAGFRIEGLQPVNQRSGSACNYDISIRERTVAVKGGKLVLGEPSFGTTLSEGDRRSLALAVFFSDLDRKPDLSETTVVIDDPMTSLDENRALVTAQTIRGYAKKVGQLIVLSHNKGFLSEIVNGVRQAELEYVSLEIVQGDKGSIIRSWEISEEWESPQYHRHTRLTGYYKNPAGDFSPEEVANAIRPYLEEHLRGSKPAYFKRKSTIGPFLDECKRKLDTPDEILNERDYAELRSIIEYANRPHHSGNGAGKSTDTELQKWVKRTLDFVNR